MENTATVKLGGTEYQLRSSNWAAQLYADEFWGRTRGSYNGSLAHDASAMLSECLSEEADEDGGIRVKFTPPSLFWMVWALAYAGGSISVGFDQWMGEHKDELWTAQEQAEACVEVIDLVTRTFFLERA